MPLDIPNRNRKILLFLSSGNPLWNQILGRGEHTHKEINQIAGIAAATVQNWKKGSNLGPGTASRIFTKTKEYIRSHISDDLVRKKTVEQVSNFENAYVDDKAHAFEAAAILKMTYEDCRKTLDEIMYEQWPIFHRMYYESSNTDDSHLPTYQGVYNLWIRRNYQWLQCALHVRYLTKIGDGHVIRCKLNVPRMTVPPRQLKYYKYDGFLIVKEKIFWMFEKRESNETDYFYMITGKGLYENEINLIMCGSYLTTGQDIARVIVSDDVLIEKVLVEDALDTSQEAEIPPVEDKTPWEQFMRRSPEVIRDPTRAEEINDLLTRRRALFGPIF